MTREILTTNFFNLNDSQFSKQYALDTAWEFMNNYSWSTLNLNIDILKFQIPQHEIISNLIGSNFKDRLGIL